MARQLLSRRGGAVAATAALLLAVATLLWWLRYPAASVAASVQPVSAPAGAGARLPRLAAHPAGGAVLSWVEPAPDGGHVLRAARYRDGRFETPVEVARGRDWFVNWGDFPSVVPIAADFWLAHWLVRHPRADSPYHYGIAMAGSSDDGRRWTSRPAPHADVGPAEHGFAAIAALDDRAAMVWLDGRANDARHSFALRSADIDRDGAAGAEAVVDGDVCSCCWPALARTRGNLWVAYRGRTSDEIRDFQLRRRTAEGWSAPIPLAGEGWRIAGCPTNGVSLAARGERLAAAWFTAAGGSARVRAAFIRDGVPALEAVHDIDIASPVGRPAIAWLGDDTAAVLYISAPAQGAALADLRLTQASGDGVGRSLTLAKVPANRDSGVPQLLAVGGELLIAWTDIAPRYGVRMLRVPQRAVR
ncbi:MAG TPA: hypothetical protein VFV18_06015 [Porticoccaceae bacterium]|nr:hypothetical protein [Porticoccaceae bacterium]